MHRDLIGLVTYWQVARLLAIPISEKELKYAKNKGSDALDELFEKEQIDIFKENRYITTVVNIEYLQSYEN